MEKCSRELAKKIFESSRTENADGLSVEIKDVPDGAPGVMDAREYVIRKAIFDFQKHLPQARPSIEFIRSRTKTYTCSLNDREIPESSFELECGGRSVTVYACNAVAGEKKTAAVYVHGGSFFAGEAASYRNPCMFLAEKADCAVFNIEYSLAPEHPYPCAVQECTALLERLYDEPESFGIDKDRIVLCGDSAGGNIAVSTALTLPERIKLRYMALFYPCPDLCGEDGPYVWRESDFDIADEQRELILSRLDLGRKDGGGNRELMALVTRCYLGENYRQVWRQEHVSVIYADLSALPKCTVFSAEYDGLRPQGEYFVRRLLEYGLDARNIRYRGVSHAFLDYFGFVPQAEAALLEAAREIRAI